MSIDFSWLVTALTNVASNIVNFFSGISSAVSQIINTGQGIFAGLANFGGWLYQAIVDGLNLIWNGLKWIGDQFRSAWEFFGSIITTGINFLAQNLFAVGQWLWAGLQGIANMIVNGILYLINVLYGFLVNTWNSLWTFIANFKQGIDTWFSNLIYGIRQKIKQSIIFTVTTHMAWKGMERLPSAKSLKEWMFGLGSIIIAPLPAFFMAEMIDVLLPSTSITPQKVAPDFGALSFTPPTFEQIAPSPPTPTTPTALAVGIGVTVEARSLSMILVDKIVSPTISKTAEGFSESEQSQSVSPTISVTTETIP